MTQEEALTILKTGANVFLTGEPGSGKSFTINQYVSYLRARGVEPSVTASTGIAATHIGGMTIHSWSGIGIRKWLSKIDLDYICSNEYLVKRLTRARVLIIDEVSMLAPDTLDMVDAVCREVRGSADPFGGLQTILVGDFFQLPPIVKGGERSQQSLINSNARFAYDSAAWKRANFLVCYLTEQHRQEDKDFFSVLSAIRSNRFEKEHLSQIELRKTTKASVENKTPKIYTHNIDVDEENERMLAKINSKPEEFKMTSHGQKSIVETLKKGCLSPEILTLKIGAEVMFTKNNPKAGYVNGTLGRVKEFESVTGMPIVETRGGKEIMLEPAEWTIEENGRVRALISQLPLRLAWAITVHKSQGMSLDEAVLNLAEVFEYGQGYVALSRVRTFGGLHLLGWNDRSFEVHPEVLEKNKEFRESSEVARTAFADLSKEELKRMQSNFILASGGDDAEEIAENVPVSKSGYFDEIRKQHSNAYRSWSPEHDELLKKLFSEGEKIAAIAEKLGRKTGGITSRLVKLGLVESREKAREIDETRMEEEESEPVKTI